MEVARCDGFHWITKEFVMMYSIVAVGALFTAVAFVPVIGAALIVLVLLGLFLLALVGVISSVGDRNVRQHEPVLDPKGWRNGS
jgi:hypothetical protein